MILERSYQIKEEEKEKKPIRILKFKAKRSPSDSSSSSSSSDNEGKDRNMGPKNVLKSRALITSSTRTNDIDIEF